MVYGHVTSDQSCSQTGGREAMAEPSNGPGGDVMNL